MCHDAPQDGVPTVRDEVRAAQQLLLETGINTPQQEAVALLARCLGVDRSWVLAHDTDLFPCDQLALFRSWILRRAQFEPTAYITGEKEFFGLSIKVNQSVLIPRPETELLCEQVLARVDATEALNICDIGTGSGCVGIALAKHLPKARVWATDISRTALLLAAENARQCGVGHQMVFAESDVLNGSGLPEKFDVIVSNPPYIPTSHIDALMREVRLWEPQSALDGGRCGLGVIFSILSQASSRLVPQGFLALETGHNQHVTIVNTALRLGWLLIGCWRDLAGYDRVVLFGKTLESLPKIVEGAIGDL